MRPWTRRPALRYAAGVVCYLLGTVLAAALVVGLLVPSGEASPVERLTLPYLLSLAASTGLIVVGRTLLRTARDAGSPPPGALQYRRPESTTLERLGYRSPPPETDREFVHEDGEVYAVCRECGERNGQAFDYCRRCSAELPE